MVTERDGATLPPVDASRPEPPPTSTPPVRPAGPARPTRLTDVADRAGVSVKTVSNVVNGYVHVSAQTRAKVAAALAELDYRPNLTARNLRRGRSGVVALAVPDLELPYFAELAVHLVRAARERGWTVLIDQTDGELEREQLALENFGSQLVDGLVFSPLASGVPELSARRARTPMVLLGERVYDGPDDHVSIDNVAAAAAAVGHLLDIGRRRVAAVGQQSVVSAETARLRVLGYREALTTAGHHLDPQLVVSTESFTRAEGAAAVDQLFGLSEPPDALFCFNDLLALGAVRRLHERGLRVPEDVAVVGIDDIEDGRFSTPTLTTVRPDKERIAHLAIELLAERIDATLAGTVAGPSAGREIEAPYELVVRESTAG